MWADAVDDGAGEADLFITSVKIYTPDIYKKITDNAPRRCTSACPLKPTSCHGVCMFVLVCINGSLSGVTDPGAE